MEMFVLWPSQVNPRTSIPASCVKARPSLATSACGQRLAGRCSRSVGEKVANEFFPLPFNVF